jgi:DNA (cytosine-5)-methyltransferase 1
MGGVYLSDYMTSGSVEQIYKMPLARATTTAKVRGFFFMTAHRFPYEWTLKDANFTKDKGIVFSCFACGGGSTMGYKLAGFHVLGCNEIDPKMIEAYKVNHKPKYAYLEPIQTFKLRKDLPKELYNLDILDGSPPCSSFSMAGNREKDWGKKKKFREGQANQVLDNLFFDFIDLAKELQPKVVVAENVKGLLLGNAKEYVRQIYRYFDEAGYYCQHWLLDASKMGVPQRRERVFFICLRKDLAEPFLYQKDMFTVVPSIKLKFKESLISFKKVKKDEIGFKNVTQTIKRLWNNKRLGDIDLSSVSKRIDNRPNHFFNWMLIYEDKVPYTVTGDCKNILFNECRYLSNTELKLIGTYPTDYDFLGNKPSYLIGMSVPPVMTAQIATEIYNQWLSKL